MTNNTNYLDNDECNIHRLNNPNHPLHGEILFRYHYFPGSHYVISKNTAIKLKEQLEKILAE